MKIAIAIVAMITAAYQPALAEVTDLMGPMSWPAQLGVIGMMGILLFVQMVKVIPAEGRRHSADLDRLLDVHRECSEGISADIKEQTAETRIMRKGIQDLTETIKTRPCLLNSPEQLAAAIKASS